MTHSLASIIITPEQIITAANAISAASSEAREVSESTVRTATEHWLRSVIDRILADPDHYALSAHAIGSFAFDPDCAHPGCRRVPLANDIYCHVHRQLEDERVCHESRMAAAPLAPRQHTIEADGDVLWA